MAALSTSGYEMANKPKIKKKESMVKKEKRKRKNNNTFRKERGGK